MKKRTLAMLMGIALCFTTVFATMPAWGTEEEELNIDDEGRIITQAESIHNQSKNRDELIASIDETEIEYQIWQAKTYGLDAMRWRIWGKVSDEYTSVSVSKNLMRKVCNQTDIPMEIETTLGTYYIDNALMKYLVKKGTGKDIKLVLEKISLTNDEKSVYGEDAYACKAYFSSGGKKITDLGSNRTEIILSIRARISAVSELGRINSKGKLCDVKANFGGQVGNYKCIFDTSKLGTFVVVSSARIDYAKRVTAVTSEAVNAKVTALKNGIKVSWSKTSGFKAAGYQVYASSKKTGTYKRIKTTQKLSCTDSGLRNGTKKYYKVRAYTMVNGLKIYSKWSSVKTATAK